MTVNNSKEKTMKSSRWMYLVVGLAISTVTLTGCTTGTDTGATVPKGAISGAGSQATATQGPASDGFSDPDKPKLVDGLNVRELTVDPDGTAEYGDGLSRQDATRKGSPAPLQHKGDLYVEVHISARQVPRQITELYVARDRGASTGRQLDCPEGSPMGATAIDQWWTCIAWFKDEKYDTGNYFLIIKSKPDEGFSEYGPKVTIVPFYTTYAPQPAYTDPPLDPNDPFDPRCDDRVIDCQPGMQHQL